MDECVRCMVLPQAMPRVLGEFPICMYCSAPIAVQLSFIHTELFSGSYEELSVKDALVNPGVRCPSEHWCPSDLKLCQNVKVHL